jgi:hypothetical protein
MPSLLSDVDYQEIKDGTCVTSGPYYGCIKLGNNNYVWLQNIYPDWKIQVGLPGALQSYMTTAIWDKCKRGGTLDWSPSREAWESSPTKFYRWDGGAGDDIDLVEV